MVTVPLPYEEKHWLEYGIDYAVSEPEDQDIGGTLTILTAIPLEAEQIVIRRVTPKTQEVDLHNGGRLMAEFIETIGDKATMQIQEIAENTVTKDEKDKILQGANVAIKEAAEAVLEKFNDDFQLALEAETQARVAADIDTLNEAKTYTDAAQLATQTWIPAVTHKVNLAYIEGLNNTINYLCRVIADPVKGNNGVYQAIAGWDDEPEWTYFSDNLDFIDETELAKELAQKMNAHDTDPSAHGGMAEQVSGFEGLLGEMQDTLHAHMDTEGNAPIHMRHPDIWATIGQLNERLTETDEIARAGGGSGMAGYSFIVDSNNALNEWISARVPGKDYSSVFIKSGNWTYSRQFSGAVGTTEDNPFTIINTSDCGTKLVVADVNSTISFVVNFAPSNTSTPRNFFAVIRNTNDCILRNIRLSVKAQKNTDNNVPMHPLTFSGFYQCPNPINCWSSIVISGLPASEAHGFYECSNPVKCVGRGSGNIGYGFLRCRTGFMCQDGESSTAAFHDCYMEPETGSTPWDNTALGGYNGTEIINSAGGSSLPMIVLNTTGAVTTAPANSKVGQIILNSSTAAKNIGGVSIAIGGLAEITSISPFTCVGKGNIRGAGGSNGATFTLVGTTLTLNSAT